MKIISILLAKIAIKLLTLFKLGQGGSLAGKIALKIRENLLSEFKFKENAKIILITGTNGKSTTAGLVSAILETAGYKVAYNKSGANLKAGIVNTLCFFSTLTGVLNHDFIILEVDEATLPLITQSIKADIIAVTNLYRDQLDRFGELDTTLHLIERGINNNRDALLLLNANDSKLASIKVDNKKTYYKLIEDEVKPNINDNWLSDPIEYSNQNNIEVSCDFIASNLKADNRSSNFDVKNESFTIKKQNFFLPLIGKFNVYNALAAIAISKSATDITANHIQKAFSSFTTIFGRAEKIHINNKDVWIYLIKNPAGTTEVLKTLTTIPNSRFLFALNDKYADGRDISWIWDANFDLLKSHKKKIFSSGSRCYDMALRLKYANLESIEVEEHIEDALNLATSDLSNEETLYVLPTYTVLLELQKKKISKSQTL